MANLQHAPIVQELVDKIGTEQDWLSRFQQAVQLAVAAAPNDMQGIKTLPDFYAFMDDWLKWVPSEVNDGKAIYRKLCLFYFIFGQKPAYALQTPIAPEYANKTLSWLSDWLVRYAQELGKFLDTPESFTEKSRQTFFDSPPFHMQEYIEPHGGWKTFNQFFSRTTKPGYRPIDSITDSRVIVSPADSTFQEQWNVDSNSIMDIKGFKWSIADLLDDSDYKNEFANGIFIHSFLTPTDYHRLHTPVGGLVKEAKIIQGQAYLDVEADKNGYIRPIRRIHQQTGKNFRDLGALDTTGYQFCQMRAVFVLDTPIGLVAVLPIGMAQVSSVIMTAEEKQTLRKGEELGYFQFGGSDIVVVFQSISKVTITAEPNTAYKMGQVIGTADPPAPSRR